MNRHRPDDCRALWPRQDFQFAAVLSKSLAHTGDTHSDEGPFISLARRLRAGYSTARVPNLNRDVRGLALDTNLGCVAA